MPYRVRPDFEPHGVFSEWISSLLHYYPTQLRVKVDTSDSLILGHKTKVIIADFKNRFGEYFVKVSDHSIKDLHENMEVCVEWAVRVVEGDVFSYGPLDNPAYCMYFCAKEYVESWISEEADMHGSDPLVMVQPF